MNAIDDRKQRVLAFMCADRVYGCPPRGHRPRASARPDPERQPVRRIEFIRLFPRGVEWAATGEVSLAGPDRRGDRRINPWPYYNGEG